MHYSVSNISRQRGVALIIITVLIVISSSYALLLKLNSSTNFYIRQSKETQESLRLAKQALLSYAVNYPEIDAAAGNDKINGPGYLPCPDINNDGDAGINCSAGGNTTIGMFPYKRLEVPNLKDSSGARLWYAVSDNFRNSEGLEPLNSETPGQLTVDGNNDVVAVIIAPGPSLGDQDRVPNEAGAFDVADFLETENNDLDLVFTAIDPSTTDFTDFNDRLISITRQELMEEVEKRVLSELKAILETYEATQGVYPWLSTFADPKAVVRKLTGTAEALSSAVLLNDGDNDFTLLGVTAGDVIYNITDGSVGEVQAVSSNSLTITGLVLGTDNDFDEDDEYVVIPRGKAAQLTGTAAAGGSNTLLVDNNRDLRELGIAVHDVIENITDGSDAIIRAISEDEIEVDGLDGGVDNLFQLGDTYLIRGNYGEIPTGTATNATVLSDNTKDFIRMGVVQGDLVWNMTDGSFGRVTIVTTTSLTVDSLSLGSDNQFEANDRYMFPRFNTTTNIREGLLGFHEVGEPFKTDLDFAWDFTANAADVVVTDSNILQNYIDNYIDAGSPSYDDSVALCYWFIADMAECFVNFKDFVNISGRLTGGWNTVDVIDALAQFVTDNVKRGDIAQNYDDEILEASGIIDAANSGTATAGTTSLVLEDTNNDFSVLNIAIGDTLYNTTDGSSGTITTISANQITVSALSGGTDDIFEVGDDYRINDVPIMYDIGVDFDIYERYSYLVQNQTLETELSESKIQAIIVDTNAALLEAESYVGEGTEPMQFRPGDSYRIYEPRKFVIENVASESQLSTDNYTSVTNPDFDAGEYYRVMPASNSINERVDTVTSTGVIDRFTDASATFVADGVEVGDIVENHDNAFGEITAVTETSITTRLYGDASEDFSAGSGYTVYYNYVYSREHTIHTRFRGTQGERVIAGERVRDVCLGYTANCAAVDTEVNFSGNGGVPLFSVTDYQEDETTIVGTATFTPSALSTGTFLTTIDYHLNETTDAFPSWFFNNDWHKLIYIVNSVGDIPGAAAACAAGANCLTLNSVDLQGAAIVDSNDNNALLISAGMEVNKTVQNDCTTVLAATTQDRTTGDLNEYYEADNCNASINLNDNSFQEQPVSNIFNDQVRIIEP